MFSTLPHRAERRFRDCDAMPGDWHGLSGGHWSERWVGCRSRIAARSRSRKTRATVTLSMRRSPSGRPNTRSGTSASGSWSRPGISVPDGSRKRRLMKLDAVSAASDRVPNALPRSGESWKSHATIPQASAPTIRPRQVLWSPSTRVPSASVALPSNGARQSPGRYRPAAHGATFAAMTRSSAANQ